MTERQMQILNAAIDAAITALPDGDDQQLNDWITANVSLPPDVHEALAHEGVKTIIREEARKLGVTLRD